MDRREVVPFGLLDDTCRKCPADAQYDQNESQPALTMAIKIIVILLFCGLLELALPWYTIAIVPLVICFIAPSRSWIDFFCGFFAIFILWLGVELIHDLPNGGLLSGKVAGMIHLPSRWALLLMSAAIGGFTAGLSALCGYYLRSLTVVQDRRVR